MYIGWVAKAIVTPVNIVGGSMAITNMINAALADVFNAPGVMVVGGLVFLVVIVMSVGSGQLRRIYFPRPATEASVA